MSFIYEKIKHSEMKWFTSVLVPPITPHEGWRRTVVLAAAVTSRGSTTLTSLLPNLWLKHGGFGVHFMVPVTAQTINMGPDKALGGRP